jgi:hypothetical protein
MIKPERLNHKHMGGRSHDLTVKETTLRRNTGYSARNDKDNETAPWIQAAHRTLRTKTARERSSPASPKLISAAGIYFRRSHSASVANRSHPMAGGGCLKRQARLDVIDAYERYLDQNPLKGEFRDVLELPRNKAEILEAIAWEIVRENDPLRRMRLEARALMLSCYQEGVDSRRMQKLDDGDVLRQRMRADKAYIRIRLQAAEAMGRKLPKKLVRRIIG